VQDEDYRDTRFTLKFWKAMCKLIGSRLKMACAFHPGSNGKVERMHHALGDILRCVVNARQDDWEAALPMAELAINDSPSAATGFTPFQACYGRDPRTPLAAATGTIDEETVPAAREQVAYLEATFAMVRDAMRRHKDEACGFKREFKFQPFAVGDEVLFATKNLRVKKNAACGKLTSKYIGPFKVKAIAHRSATLDLPRALRITPHVSVDFLRRYVPRRAFRGTDDRRTPPGPIIDEIEKCWLDGLWRARCNTWFGGRATIPRKIPGNQLKATVLYLHGCKGNSMLPPMDAPGSSREMRPHDRTSLHSPTFSRPCRPSAQNLLTSIYRLTRISTLKRKWTTLTIRHCRQCGRMSVMRTTKQPL